MIRYTLTLATLVVASLATAADPVVRVVCIDKSGSMSGKDGNQTRLARAVQYVRDATQAEPPSSDSPVILITFTDKAAAPVVCSDRTALNHALEALKPDGGTRVAAGIDEATTAVERHRNKARVEVLLLTDFEDNDTTGIDRAQAKLNELFKARHKDGRVNAVYVRVWADTEDARKRRTDQLMGALIANGVATGVDLATIERVAVATKLTASVVGAVWEPNGTLRVTVRATVKLSGNRLPITATVQIKPDRGTDEFKAPLDGQPITGDILVVVSPVEMAAGTVGLVLRGPIGIQTKPFTGGVHEIAPPADAPLSITLPATTGSLKLTATAGPTRWVHLATDRAACEVVVTWELGTFVRPVAVALTTLAGVEVSPSSFTLSASSGSATVTLTARMSANQPTAFDLRATPAADPRQTISAATAKVEVTGPTPVVVRTELVQTNGKGKPRLVAEGAVSPGTRQVDFTVRPVAIDASPEVLQGLEFDLVAKGPVEADGPVPLNGSTVARLTFAGRAPLTGTERLEARAAFVPRGGATSIQPAPIEFTVLREPLGMQVLVYALGVLVVLVGGWLALRAARPNRDKYSRAPNFGSGV